MWVRSAILLSLKLKDFHYESLISYIIILYSEGWALGREVPTLVFHLRPPGLVLIYLLSNFQFLSHIYLIFIFLKLIIQYSLIISVIHQKENFIFIFWASLFSHQLLNYLHFIL